MHQTTGALTHWSAAQPQNGCGLRCFRNRVAGLGLEATAPLPDYSESGRAVNPEAPDARLPLVPARAGTMEVAVSPAPSRNQTGCGPYLRQQYRGRLTPAVSGQTEMAA